MFPDRGVAVTLTSDELRDEWLDCDHLHVSGYALLAAPVADAAARAVELARAELQPQELPELVGELVRGLPALGLRSQLAH